MLVKYKYIHTCIYVMFTVTLLQQSAVTQSIDIHQPAGDGAYYAIPYSCTKLKKRAELAIKCKTEVTFQAK